MSTYYPHFLQYNFAIVTGRDGFLEKLTLTSAIVSMTGTVPSSPDAAIQSASGQSASIKVAPIHEAPSTHRMLARTGALRYRRFRRIWAAGVVSQLGDWMQITGRAVLVYQVTGSETGVGLVFFFTYAPQTIFNLYGGALADRMDRKRIFISAEVAQMLAAGAMGVLAITGAASLETIIAVSVVSGIAQMLSMPAGSALAPALVPIEVLGNSIELSVATNSITRVIGPGIFALAIASGVDIAWIFWANALSFLGVIVIWLATPVPAVASDGERGDLSAVREALRYVKARPTLWVPMLNTAFLAAVGLVYQVLLVVFATEVLSDGNVDLGEHRFSIIQSAVGVGAAIGIWSFAKFSRRNPSRSLWVSGLAFSLALIALGTTSSFLVALGIAVFLGAFHFANATLALNVVQHHAPEEMRGRIMGLHMTGWIGLLPFTALFGGAISRFVGTQNLFMGAGALCAVFSLAIARKARHVHFPEITSAGDNPERDPLSDPLSGAALVTAIEDEG